MKSRLEERGNSRSHLGSGKDALRLASTLALATALSFIVQPLTVPVFAQTKSTKDVSKISFRLLAQTKSDSEDADADEAKKDADKSKKDADKAKKEAEKADKKAKETAKKAADEAKKAANDAKKAADEAKKAKAKKDDKVTKAEKASDKDPKKAEEKKAEEEPAKEAAAKAKKKSWFGGKGAEKPVESGEVTEPTVSVEKKPVPVKPATNAAKAASDAPAKSNPKASTKPAAPNATKPASVVTPTETTAEAPLEKPVLLPDKALVSVLEDISKSLSDVNSDSGVETADEKVIVGIAKQVLDKAIESSETQHGRILAPEHSSAAKNSMTTEAWASGDIAISDKLRGSVATVWGKRINGSLHVTIAGECNDKVLSNGEKVGEFIVVIKGRSPVKSGFDIQTQSDVSYWIGTLSNVTVDNAVLRLKDQESDEENADKAPAEKPAETKGEVKKKSVVVLEAILTRRGLEYLQALARYEHQQQTLIALQAAEATLTDSDDDTIDDADARSSGDEVKPSKSSKTDDDEDETAQSDSDDDDSVANRSKAGGDDEKVARRSKSENDDEKIARRSKSENDDEKVAKRSKSDNDDDRSARRSKSNDEDVDDDEKVARRSKSAAEDEGSKSRSKSEDGDENGGDKARTGKIASAKTQDKAKTADSEKNSATGARNDKDKAPKTADDKNKTARTRDDDDFSPGRVAFAQKTDEDSKPISQSPATKAVDSAWRDDWSKDGGSESRKLTTVQTSAPSTVSDTKIASSQIVTPTTSSATHATNTPSLTRISMAPPSPASATGFNRAWESPAVNAAPHAPSLDASLLIPERAIAGQFLTVVVQTKDHQPERAVELSFNGATLATDMNGQVSYMVPDDMPPGHTLHIGLAERPELNPRVVDILQPLDDSRGQKSPRIDRVSQVVAADGVLVVDGHDFDGFAERNRLVIDNEHPAKVIAASPVQLRVLVPSKLSPGTHSVTINSTDLRSAPAKFDFVKAEIEQQDLRKTKGVLSKITVRVQGTKQPIAVRVINKTPDIIKFSRGDNLLVTTSGGADNSYIVGVKQLKKGDYKVEASPEI